MSRSTKWPNALTYALVALAGLAACTESKQSSAPPTAKSPTPAPFPSPLPPSSDGADGDDDDDLEVECDPDEDFFKLDFPEEIKECLKKEKTYDFDAEKCTPMNKAITFDCTFDDVKKTLSELGLSAAPLEREAAKGGKLIHCSASNNGFTIVTQFFYKSPQADAKDCSFSKQGKVVSVCFRRFATETPPTLPSTDADKKAYIAECLEQE